MALVAVARFENPIEAARARELLESQGIRTALVEREPDPEGGAVFRPMTLHVLEEEATRASEALDAFWRSRPDTPEALRAMLAALLFPPLQLYSLWVIARLLRRWRELSSCDRRRVKLAAIADLCILGAAAACVLYWLS